MTRKALINKLEKTFPGFVARLGEDFDGSKGAIWTGEDAPNVNGVPMFNNYGYVSDPQETVWVMGIHRKLNELLTAAGWYAEFYDGGTVLIYSN